VKNELAAMGHPTAEELYLSLRAKYPEMSRATVYRNLKILEEAGGIIRVIGSVAGGERFDATVKPHYHFICLKCGAARDLEIPYREGENALIEEKHGVKIEGHRTTFFGYCKDCASKKTDKNGEL
jgi:Fur family peroxide stress response transcriptional regulator